jgi:hypothetical protein
MEELRYPIGQVKIPGVITDLEIAKWILILKDFPSRLEKLTIEVMN